MEPRLPIDEDVRRFVLTSVPSVPYLEAALLFMRDPVPRTIQETAHVLYVTERACADLLSSLHAAGILARDGEVYRYAPRDEKLAQTLDALAKTYAADLIGITNLIHDTTQKSARRFADAFRVRKDR